MLSQRLRIVVAGRYFPCFEYVGLHPSGAGMWNFPKNGAGQGSDSELFLLAHFFIVDWSIIFLHTPKKYDR